MLEELEVLKTISQRLEAAHMVGAAVQFDAQRDRH
jgi:hypothetical protein